MHGLLLRLRWARELGPALNGVRGQKAASWRGEAQPALHIAQHLFQLSAHPTHSPSEHCLCLLPSLGWLPAAANPASCPAALYEKDEELRAVAERLGAPFLQGEKERKPAGLPIKTLEGEVVFQRAQQGAGGRGAGAGAAAADVAPAPSQLAVAGVTIQDDLAEKLLQEEQERREAEAQQAQQAAAAREAAAAKDTAAAATGARRGGDLWHAITWQA